MRSKDDKQISENVVYYVQLYFAHKCNRLNTRYFAPRPRNMVHCVDESMNYRRK